MLNLRKARYCLLPNRPNIRWRKSGDFADPASIHHRNPRQTIAVKVQSHRFQHPGCPEVVVGIGRERTDRADVGYLNELECSLTSHVLSTGSESNGKHHSSREQRPAPE